MSVICKECGWWKHATTCSQAEHTEVVHHAPSDSTYRLTVRGNDLIRLEEMTNDFPLTWTDVPLDITH